MAWYECWGTYSATGPYNNVAMGGNPQSSIHGLDLNPAKGAGYGKGIEFRQNPDGIYVHVNLIGYAIDTSVRALLGQSYVRFGGTYDWYADYWVSRDGGRSWETIGYNVLVARHNDNQSLAYTGNWGLSNIDWSNNIKINGNWTHFKIEVRGDEPGQRHQNIYTYEQVAKSDDIKPWAIRKSNVFKTLNVASGWFKIRKSNNWTDKSKMLESDVNKDNAGTSRIRRSGTWKGQNKIGS